MATTNIYILRLEGGRFYIGKSADPQSRYVQHLQGNGCAWTKKYRPVELMRTIRNASVFDEDKYTKEYMAKYGIDKVRGGTYVTEELEPGLRASLLREIWAATDCCTRCGRKGHFVKACNARTDTAGNSISVIASSSKRVWNSTVQRYIDPTIYEDDSDEEDDEDEDDDEESDDDDEEEDEFVWGCEYCDRTFTTAFGCSVHEKTCKEKQATVPALSQSAWYARMNAAKARAAELKASRGGDSRR